MERAGSYIHFMLLKGIISMMTGIGYSRPARGSRGCIYNGSERLAGWLERKFVNNDLIDGLAI